MFVKASAVSVNAGPRLDRLPISRFHWRILGLISAGAFLDAFDVYLAGGVIAALKAEKFATLAQAATFLSATFLGMLIGAAMAGHLGDRFGRRYSYQFNLALFGFASVAAVFAPSMNFLILCRFVMGVGLGAELVVAAGTLGEFIPPSHRGRWGSIMGTIIGSGLLVATMIGFVVIPNLGWRYMFAIAGAGALLIWVLRKKMPESPRWLESVGRLDEAESLLREIEAEVQAEKGPLPAPVDAPAVVLAHAPLSRLFSPGLRGRLFAATLTAVSINVSVYGFVAWLPTFLVGKGQTMVQSLGFTTLMSFGSIVGSLIAVAISDKVSRRTSMVVSGLLILLFGALYPNAEGAVALAVTGFLLVTSIYVLTAIGLFLYVPELFPTAYRLRGTGFAGMCARAASMATPFLTVALFQRFGLEGVLAMVGSVLALMMIAILAVRIETRGASLDEIAQTPEATPETAPFGLVGE
jgi:MFS transporter, putative metabolite:H+ symporter